MLRAHDSLHTIDNGRFDFEFQALKEDHQYVNCFEGFDTDAISSQLDSLLVHLTKPIKALVERVKAQRLSAIHLSSFETTDFGHMEGMEGDGIRVSSGMLLGSSAT